VTLPVEPERLRAEFPDLTDEDLAAYSAVTRRILADPAARGRIVREVMASAQEAAELAERGLPLTKAQLQALQYRKAVARMQRSTVR
jgi:hypothetical protein